MLGAAGAGVLSLERVGQGCPDLLVCFRRTLYLIEVKDGDKPPAERKLTPAQVEFHRTWPGPIAVVTNRDEALRAIGLEVADPDPRQLDLISLAKKRRGK